MRLFIVTGTCGAGKSTMRDSLGETLINGTPAQYKTDGKENATLLFRR